MILVSACLLGKPVRYDGKSKESVAARQRLNGVPHVLICPECLGGLPIPREPSEIVGGDGADVLDGRARVLSRTGQDVTEAFLLGAQKVLELCHHHGATEVWLKSRSPSCGVGTIHDGSFAGGLRPGDGVTAALLKRNCITVVEMD